MKNEKGNPDQGSPRLFRIALIDLNSEKNNPNKKAGNKKLIMNRRLKVFLSLPSTGSSGYSFLNICNPKRASHIIRIYATE